VHVHLAAVGAHLVAALRVLVDRVHVPRVRASTNRLVGAAVHHDTPSAPGSKVSVTSRGFSE
jgi:hypothetical protein